jgi:hypothetical protein
MKLRSREYFKRKRRDKFIDKIFHISSDYQLATLKIKQLIRRGCTPIDLEKLENSLKDSENKLHQLIEP